MKNRARPKQEVGNCGCPSSGCGGIERRDFLKLVGGGTLALALAEGAQPGNVQVKLGGAQLACQHRVENGKVIINLTAEAVIHSGQNLEVAIA